MVSSSLKCQFIDFVHEPARSIWYVTTVFLLYGIFLNSDEEFGYAVCLMDSQVYQSFPCGFMRFYNSPFIYFAHLGSLTFSPALRIDLCVGQRSDFSSYRWPHVLAVRGPGGSHLSCLLCNALSCVIPKFKALKLISLVYFPIPRPTAHCLNSYKLVMHLDI